MPKSLSRLNTFWKFFIDVSKWTKNDPYVFDKDKSSGYFRNASLGLLCMIQSMDIPGDDFDFIIALRNLIFHDKTSRGLAINVWSGIGKDSFTDAGLRDLFDKLSSNPGILPKNEYPLLLRVDGRFDLASELYNGDQDLILKIVNGEAPYEDSFVSLSRQEPIKKVVMKSLVFDEQYRAELKEAKSEDETITAIVNYIQNMHQEHAFPDGNGRTYIFFILNKLLLENGLAPTIVNNPSNFTAWSVPELVNEVKTGQLRFESLCDKDEKEDAQCTRLLTDIRNTLKLTPEVEEKIILKRETFESKVTQFKQSLITNVSEQAAILDEIPLFQRIHFIKTVLSQENSQAGKSYLDTLLKNLRYLTYYGFDYSPALMHFTVLHSEKFATIEPLLELLYQTKFHSDEAWCKLVVDLVLSNKQDAFTTLIYTSDKFQHKPWYDEQRYIAMLKAHHYVTFDAKSEALTSINVALIAKSDLVKKYLYLNPTISNDVIGVIRSAAMQQQQNKSFAADDEAEKWLQLMVQHPEASYSIKYAFTFYGEWLEQNPEIKALCFTQPLAAKPITTALRQLEKKPYYDQGKALCLQHPMHAEKIVEAMKTLEQRDMLESKESPDILSLCMRQPEHADTLAFGLMLLTLGKLKEREDLQDALFTMPKDAEHLARAFTLLHSRGQLNVATIAKCLESPWESVKALDSDDRGLMFFKPAVALRTEETPSRTITPRGKGGSGLT